LHEVGYDAKALKRTTVPDFEERAALVAEDLGFDETEIGEFGLDDPHQNALSFSRLRRCRPRRFSPRVA
jgi:hypothetical protein